MNTHDKTTARILFRNKVLMAKGQQFEDFFVQILGYARKDFRPIKPQGKVGDRKNDGCEPKVGRYYQVYAPEDATTKESASVKKIIKDFAGLKKYWGSLYSSGITEFHFVLNDQYRGSYPTTMATLREIEVNHALKVCDVLLCKNLEEIAFTELEEDQLRSVVGYIPDTSLIVKIDYSILTEVIAHILTSDPNKAVRGKLVSPEFDQKIQFNHLVYAEGYLKAASYLTGHVDEFFDLNTDFARQAVREALNVIYIEATQQNYQDDLSNKFTKEDQIYFYILSKATPYVKINGKEIQTQEAVRVLIAYFFETCDIFEEPI